MKKLFSLLFFFVLFFISGCGGNNSSSSSVETYSLIPEKNYALLGPLKEATLEIYQLNNFEEPVFSGKTSSDGAFPDLSSISGVSDDEFLLVVVSGGCDIDKNDDGIIDDVCTPNKGTLKGFVEYAKLKEGGIRITVLSDLIYRFLDPLKSRIAQGSWSKEDFEELLNTLSKVTGASNYEDILRFSPLSRPSWLYSDIDYISLAKFYLNGEERKIESKTMLIASRSDFSIGDRRFLKLRKNVKFNVVYDRENTHLNVYQNGESVGDLGYLPMKAENIVIKVDWISSGNKLIGWMGCDNFDIEEKTCFIEQLKDDRIVAPVVVAEISKPDNVLIFDLSSSLIDLGTEESTVDIPLNSTLLDEIKVISDNETLFETIRNALKEGSNTVIVVNKNPPEFFRKVISISGEVGNFTLKTSFIELSEIFKDGYVTTIPSSQNGEVKLISRRIVLPDGTEVPFDPETEKIVLDFSQKTIFVSDKTTRYSISGGGDWGWSETYNDTYGPVHLDSKNATTLNGTIEIEPYVDFTYSWQASIGWTDADVSIKSIYLNTGCNLSTNGNFTAELKKEFNTHKVWYDKLKYKQTFTIYGIPVVVTEKIPLVYGIRGVGTGKESDNATIYGNLTVNFSASINPGFQVVYSGGNFDTNFILNPVFHEDAEANLRADTFAYIGAEPSIAVYGVGVKMNNYLGPYGLLEVEFEGNASQSVSFNYEEMNVEDILYSYNGTVKLKGELGLGYYGRILAMTELDTKLSHKIVDKINESIRGKYTEFWKSYPVIEVSKVASISGVSDRGVLSITGPTSLTILAYEGESVSKNIRFTIKNIGGKELNWKVAYSADDEIQVEFSSLNGTLGPNESTNINVTVGASLDNIEEPSLYSGYIYFYEGDTSKTTAVTKALSPIFSMNTVFEMLSEPKYSIPMSISAIPAVENWNATFWIDMESFPYQKIIAGWSDAPEEANIDGYIILVSKHEDNVCSSDYTILSMIDNYSLSDIGFGVKYSNPLSALTNANILEKGSEYCFRIYAYKNTPLVDPSDFHIIGYTQVYFPPQDNNPTILTIPTVIEPFSTSIDNAESIFDNVPIDSETIVTY